MKIGEADIVEDIDGPRGKLTSSGPGSGSGGGRGGSGGGDGPKGYEPDDLNMENEATPDKTRVLTWFLLLVVLMTFGGLIGAYVVISTNNVAEWQPTSLPIPVWISTILIIISSVTYHFGELGIKANNHDKTKKYLIATTVLGAMFIASQLLAWIELYNRGLYMQGNPYVGFFYLLTAVHAIHVIGGIAGLASVQLRTWLPTSSDEVIKRRTSVASAVGWYWHFMGLLWIVLFVLLGFWK